MKNGPYELVVAPKDYPGVHYRGRYVYQHHLVWWINTGRVVPKGYEIHHVDGDHRNNYFGNLRLLTSAAHRKVHGKLKRKTPIETVCGFCKKKIFRTPADYRFKLKTSKLGKFFCSQSCGAKYQHSGVAKPVRPGPVKTAIAGANPAPGAKSGDKNDLL